LRSTEVVNLNNDQPRLKKWLNRIWDDALADADLSTDDLRLLAVKAESFDHRAASCYPPHQFVDQSDHDLDFWNEVPQRNRFYRVVIPIWRTRPGIAGLVRHELEHVRQVKSDECLAKLHGDALNLVTNGKDYQRIPMETDANAAGSMFARKRYGGRRIEERISLKDRDCAVLRQQEGPPSLDTLPQRMRDFIAARHGAADS
jgi:hypothetical protein